MVNGANHLLQGQKWAWLWDAALKCVNTQGRTYCGMQHWVSHLGALAQKAQTDDLPLVSRKTASRQLNIHQHTVDHLVYKGSLASSINIGNRMFVDALEVEQINQHYAQSLGRIDVIKRLGISRPTLQKLVNRGLLQAVPGEKLPRARERRFDIEQLGEMVKDIVGHLPICELRATNTDILDLRGAIYSLNQSGIDMADLLIAVRDRHLPGFRTSNEISLKNLCFDRQVITEFRRRSLGTHRTNALSAQQTATLLGVTLEVLGHIRRNGLLTPTNAGETGDFRHWLYGQDDVKTFQQSYVDSKEAAPVIGISQRQVTAWVRSGWLHAASGPHIDGARTYRFEQEALVRWRYERMVSKQVREYIGISKRTLEQWVAHGKLVPLKNMPKHPLWFARQDVNRLAQSGESCAIVC